MKVELNLWYIRYDTISGQNSESQFTVSRNTIISKSVFMISFLNIKNKYCMQDERLKLFDLTE